MASPCMHSVAKHPCLLLGMASSQKTIVELLAGLISVCIGFQLKNLASCTVFGNVLLPKGVSLCFGDTWHCFSEFPKMPPLAQHSAYS